MSGSGVDLDLADGTYTAVVDSVEGGLATVFFEEDGEDVADALVDAEMLPEEGRHADAIFSLAVEDSDVIEWEYDETLTDERREAAQDRFDSLSKRTPSDNDK